MRKSIGTREHDIFSELLRNVRVAAGLTQQQLADLLGTGVSRISDYERGQRRMDLVELEKYCRALGVPLVVFAGLFADEIERFRREG